MNIKDEIKILNPDIRTVQRGIILPITRDKNSCGVIDADGEFVRESATFGATMNMGRGLDDGETVSPVEVHERVIFLGYLVRHWGHFIVDSLSRLYALRDERFRDCKAVLLSEELDRPVSMKSINANILELLSYAGATPERMIDVKAPTQFDEVIVPSAGYDIDGNYSREYTDFLDYIAEKADDLRPVPEKVYLSRTDFWLAKLKENGEEYIERAFADNGYEVMHPERMTFTEQAALFRRCREIVCVNGTIPLNVIFANSGLKLVVLNKTSSPHYALMKACRMKNIQPVYIDVYREPFGPVNQSMGPFWLSVNEELQRYFADNGMRISPRLIRKSHGVKEWCRYLRNKFIEYFIYSKTGIFLRRVRRSLAVLLRRKFA